jgi:gamma-glutamylcyclotransferase (GGCT)/AIG2-like uncharacterized protein YtfP
LRVHQEQRQNLTDEHTLHLFAYGTLMCPEIMIRVVTTLPASLPARLDHYRRGPLLGVDYPAIFACNGAAVDGLLYLDLPEAAWSRLDDFEDKIYSRQPVTVQLADGRRLAAETYVLRDEYHWRLGQAAWSFEEFLKSGQARFTREYDNFPPPTAKDEL